MPDPQDTLIVGVDGGGSTCRVVIARPGGGVLARATGGAANASTDLAGTIACVTETLSSACAEAGIGCDRLGAARGHVGLAGVIDDALARTVADALPIGTLRVTDDRPTSMAGALGTADGYVAAIGTGSFLGVQRGAVQEFVGGWGLQLGDEASGAWIGRQLLARLLRHLDGLEPGSDLLAETLAGFGGQPAAVIRFAAAAGPEAFATHAEPVLAAAQADDDAALAILGQGASYIRRGLDRLGFHPGDRLCLIGGLGPYYARYLGASATAGLTGAKGNALDGALALAEAIGP